MMFDFFYKKICIKIYLLLLVSINNKMNKLIILSFIIKDKNCYYVDKKLIAIFLLIYCL